MNISNILTKNCCSFVWMSFSIFVSSSDNFSVSLAAILWVASYKKNLLSILYICIYTGYFYNIRITNETFNGYITLSSLIFFSKLFNWFFIFCDSAIRLKVMKYMVSHIINKALVSMFFESGVLKWIFLLVPHELFRFKKCNNSLKFHKFYIFRIRTCSVLMMKYNIGQQLCQQNLR